MNETSGSSASTGSSTYFYLYGDATLSVTSADLESTRTATCIINVDDASKVTVSRYTNGNITLVNGANTVKFNPNAESPFQISHANYGENLYQVSLNGTTQTDSYGRYQVTVADGDTLDIKADFPDEPTTISFSYGDNEADVLGCISVKVDGVAVENFDGKTLTAKLGQKISIIGDTNLYNFNYSIYVDGASTYFSGNYEFTATKTEYAITVNATKYTTFNVYASVDNPEYVSLYAGNSNTAISASTEVTVIELISNNNYINIVPATDCYITSILVNGNEYGSNYGTSSVTVRNLAENDTIVISTNKLIRDKVATIWVDDLTAAQYGYSVQRYSDRASVSLVSGEAVTVNFADTDNPYYMSFYQPTYCSVFNNGIYLAPQYEGSTSYYVTLVDGDAIKVYLASVPEKYAVTITDNAGAVASVATDGQNYATWSTGFSVLKDTEVTITLTEGTDVSVLVDGVAVEAAENGVYTVVITQETNIVVDKTNSIENVAVSNVGENNNVYNLQGILVIKNASAEQIAALPAGMYIINGKKIVK